MQRQGFPARGAKTPETEGRLVRPSGKRRTAPHNYRFLEVYSEAELRGATPSTPTSERRASRWIATLTFARRWGLDGVELTQYYFPETSAAYLNARKCQLLLRGLELAGTAIGGSFCVAAEEERKKHIEFTKEWLDISARLGSPCLRVFAGPPRRGTRRRRPSGGWWPG